MHSLAKRQVSVRLACDVQLVRRVKLAFVPIGRSEHRLDKFTGCDCRTVDRHRLKCIALTGDLHRGIVPQQLFNGRFD